MALIVQLTSPIIDGPVEPIILLTFVYRLLRVIVGDLRRWVITNYNLCYLPLARTHQDLLRYIVILDLRGVVEIAAVILVMVLQVVGHVWVLSVPCHSVVGSHVRVLRFEKILIRSVLPVHELAVLVLGRLPLMLAHGVRIVTALVEESILIRRLLLIHPIRVLAMRHHPRMTTNGVLLLLLKMHRIVLLLLLVIHVLIIFQINQWYYNN